MLDYYLDPSKLNERIAADYRLTTLPKASPALRGGKRDILPRYESPAHMSEAIAKAKRKLASLDPKS